MSETQIREVKQVRAARFELHDVERPGRGGRCAAGHPCPSSVKGVCGASSEAPLDRLQLLGIVEVAAAGGSRASQ